MSLVSCENGHIFDDEEFDFCPHCNRVTEEEQFADIIKGVFERDNDFVAEDPIDSKTFDFEVVGLIGNVMDEGNFKICRFCNTVYYEEIDYSDGKNKCFCDNCGMKLFENRFGIGFETETAVFDIKVDNNIRKLEFAYGRVFQKLYNLYNSFKQGWLYYEIKYDVLKLYISDGEKEERYKKFTANTYKKCIYNRVEFYKIDNRGEGNTRYCIRDYKEYGYVNMPDSTEYDTCYIVRWMISTNPLDYIEISARDDILRKNYFL